MRKGRTILVIGAAALLLLNMDMAFSASSTIRVIGPGAMHGWAFMQEPIGTGSGTGSMVYGPATPPMGKGSARLTVSNASDGMLLGVLGYNGVRLADIDGLKYWTYRTSGSNPYLAISLQFNIDKDVTDADNSFQGRLVFEPYYTAGALPDNTWQEWNATDGKWWFTKPHLFGNQCDINNPCTWSYIISTFPNIGIHPVLGAVILKAGSGWASFDGNVDALTISVNGDSITYDFEPSFYTLTLSDPDATINIGDSITASTETNDYTVDDVKFRWFNPSGVEVRTQTVSITYDPVSETYKADDTFTPTAVGPWTIYAEFNDGTVLITTLNVGFMVVPESILGALGMVGAGIGVLAIRYMRNRQKPI
ncbi:MAG: hypothetical protein QXD90_07455 [Candidatus Nitrosocaldus sp.]